jgi:hypothetical protein
MGHFGAEPNAANVAVCAVVAQAADEDGRFGSCPQ